MTLNLSSVVLGTSRVNSSLEGTEVIKKESASLNEETEQDEAVISDEAKKLQEWEAEKQNLLQMLEESNEETEDSGFSDMIKALEIFRRIINGDKVPSEDEKFLMEYDSDMYLKAKTLAVSNKKPKKYDSLVDDEKDSNLQNIEAPANNTLSSAEGSSESESSSENSEQPSETSEAAE